MNNRFLMYVFVIITAGLVSRWVIPASASVWLRMAFASAITVGVYAVVWGASNARRVWRWILYCWVLWHFRSGGITFMHGTMHVRLFADRIMLRMYVDKPYRGTPYIQRRMYGYRNGKRELMWNYTPHAAAALFKSRQEKGLAQ